MEEKIGKTSVSRPGDLSEGEIDATVKAILEDTDVQELLAKIGITKGQAYQDLSNKKFILPKKNEDEVGYAKRYIKFQVVAILMNKYNEKIHDDTTEEAREAWKKFALTHNTNMRRGDADAIIAMIENNYLLPSKDGKTAKKLTQKQKDIIVRKLREGVNSIDELLEEMEFEDEEPEQEFEGNIEAMTGKKVDENSTAIPEVGDSEIADSADEIGIVEEKTEQTGNNQLVSEDVIQGEVITPESKKYKKVEMEDNEFLEKNPEYRDATYYIPPVNSTIESIANDLLAIKASNFESKIMVIFDGIPIDPQKTPTQKEMIDAYNEQVAKREAASVEQLLQNRSGIDNKAKKDKSLKSLTQNALTPKGAVELQGNMGQVKDDRKELNQELGILNPDPEQEKAQDTVEHVFGPNQEDMIR